MSDLGTKPIKSRKKRTVRTLEEQLKKKQAIAQRKTDKLKREEALDEKKLTSEKEFEAKRESDTSVWPIDRFWTEPDLVPFSESVITQAQKEYQEDGKIDKKDPAFWHYLFTHPEKYPRDYSYQHVVADDNSLTVPTPEFPWSVEQLMPPKESPQVREFYVQKFNTDPKYREKIQQTPPIYNFQQTELALENSEILQMAVHNELTEYIPWSTKKILHFMVILWKPEDIPVRPRKYLNHEDGMKIRIALLQQWSEDSLLCQYLLKSRREPVSKLQFFHVAPLSTFLTSYVTWDSKIGKELPKERLHNMWANDIILRTYQFYKNASYFRTLYNWQQQPKNYGLYQTSVGILALLKTDQILLLQRGVTCVELKATMPALKLTWNFKTFLQHANNLLQFATSKAAQSHNKTTLPKNNQNKPQEDENDDNEVIDTKQERAISDELQEIFTKIKNINYGWESFLHVLYRQNTDFQIHTSVVASSPESLKALYMQAHLPRSKEDQIAYLSKIKKSKKETLQKQIHDWATSLKKGEKQNHIIQTFEQDARVYLHDTTPLLFNSYQYQRYIKKTWPQYILPKVSAHPSQSTCDEVGGVRVRDRTFINPDNAQLFFNANFNPGSFANGEIVVHSVGSGKTCLAIRVASDFARAGFRIVWVTKTSLKNQVLKNHMSEICNLLIRAEYDRILWLQGAEAAAEWIESLPSQTSFQNVLKTLKGLGMDWINLSYRQLSNALEDEPLNPYGRDWNFQGELAMLGKQADPLRKTVLLIDEAHKMFTGELDQTELPNVDIIHKRIQQSYKLSGPQRCRVLFLTATPTTDTFLPLFNMLNMLHPENVFPYQMVTIDPHKKVDEGLLEHIQEVQAVNRVLEKKAACQIFPMKGCEGQDQKEDEDGDIEEADVNAFFDAKSIIGGITFNPKDLNNNLENFWEKAYGLISYYNISADYSKFPRTEYMPIIMPSATITQERLMASELIAPYDDLSALSKKIRQISAWAVFQSTTAESRKPTELDEIIMAENKRHTYFEPTYEDLQVRLKLLQEMMATENESQPSLDDLEVLNKYQKRVQEIDAQSQILTERILILDEEKANLLVQENPQKSRKQQIGQLRGQLSKEFNKLHAERSNYMAEIDRLQSQLNYFETRKALQIRYYQQKIERVQRRLSAMARKSAKHSEKRHNHHDFSKLLTKLTDEDFAEKEEEKAEVNPRNTRRNKDKEKLKQQQKKKLKKAQEDEEEEEEDETDLTKVDIEEAQEEEARKLPAEYYVKKTWLIDHKRALPNEKPKVPKKHFFDQPETFDAEQFLKDIPLYSPKLAKLLEVIHDNDQKDVDSNPEDQKKHRYRKRMIFCEDIHAIRAVAGGLTAQGWNFGMKRQWVYWRKEYFDSTTNKKVGSTITSKARTLTWLPDTTAGEDYKRFLVLTKSKIGGISGTTLNDYSIQSIGAKGEEATYNHVDNVHGKDYRIIIIDRNFIEGIDLPSTYADLFDPVLAQSTRTQIVGRVSRFCGMIGLPFIPNEGWPQKIYRYGLKFHTIGLHLTANQSEKLRERVDNPKGPFAAIIPEKYREGFLEKIERNLFSPVELQVLLDDNMDAQRIKKKTLDVYMALMEKASIGSLLYAPAMRNLEAAKHDLDELLVEEEETENEYRQEVFNRDRQNRLKQANYQLRSQAQNLKNQWNIQDSHIIKLLDFHVARKFRKTNSLADKLALKDEAVLRSFFDHNIRPALNDANVITVSPELAFTITRDMVNERVKYAEEILTNRVMKAQVKAQKRDKSDIKAMIKRYLNLTLTDKLGKRAIRALSGSDIEQIWQKVTAEYPQITREQFDTILQTLKEKKARSQRRPQSAKSTKSKKSKTNSTKSVKRVVTQKEREESRKSNSRKESRKDQEESEPSVKPTISPQPKKPRKQNTKEFRVLMKVKKDLKINLPKLKKSEEKRQELIQAVLAADSSLSKDIVTKEVAMLLAEKK
jgi:hypothetical protein